MAVVAILRELGKIRRFAPVLKQSCSWLKYFFLPGTSETLGMIIEGESLLNDGVAIFMYEIFAEVAKDEPDLLIKVIVMIFKIGLGGPIFGYIAGKICVFALSLIFNDGGNANAAEINQYFPI